MSDAPDDAPPASKPSRLFSRRTLVLVLILAVVGVAAWMILTTEMHVADLRARGFTDVAIDSARDHAYFPLIGGVVGSVSFVLLGRLIRSILGGKQS